MDDYLVGIWQILEDSYETMHLLSKAFAGSYKIIFLPDSYKITIFPPETYKITLFCQNLTSPSSGRFCQIIVFLADSSTKNVFLAEFCKIIIFLSDFGIKPSICQNLTDSCKINIRSRLGLMLSFFN